MHLRRALLLFAIVLGLAALATSVSRPARDSGRDSGSEAPAAPEPVPAGAPPELRLPEGGRNRSVVLEAGQAATLVVPGPGPGRVDLPGFGLSAPTEPLTPARFELLADERGSYRVFFSPADGSERRSLGRVLVR